MPTNLLQVVKAKDSLHVKLKTDKQCSTVRLCISLLLVVLFGIMYVIWLTDMLWKIILIPSLPFPIENARNPHKTYK